MSSKLLHHYIDSVTNTANRDPMLSSTPAPMYSAVGDMIRGMMRSLRRLRRRVW